jgi:hypothetical protein
MDRTMTEAKPSARASARSLAPLAVLLVLCGIALGTEGAVASPVSGHRPTLTEPLPIPGGFRLPASNGYTLYVVASPPRDDHPGSIELVASAKGKAVTYRAPAEVTETTMQSNLGALGEISLTFQRSNQAATAPCGKQKVRFDSGYYEGKIEFHGEEGYTSAEATTVPGDISFLLAEFCGEIFSGSSFERRPGAELFVRNPALGPQLSVRKARPKAAAVITASVSEYTNGISIHRYESRWMHGNAFTYDSHLRTATIRPPAPFSGSARFDRRKKAGQRWRGDLTVDVPGRSDIPLTGPSLRATLTPAN